MARLIDVDELKAAYGMKDDSVSRAAVLNLIEQSCCDLEYDCDNVALRKEVEALPSAQSEQRWIPCSERDPEENGNYLVTRVEYGWAAKKYTTISVRGFYGRQWDMKGVVAWMPLPEPYRAKGDE